MFVGIGEILWYRKCYYCIIFFYLVFFFNKIVKVVYKVLIYVFWYVFIYDSVEINRDNWFFFD